jgi:hypothetical protein
MSTTDIPHDELAQAEVELEAAKATVGETEDALLDGKPGVSTADLVQAEILVREKSSILGRIREIHAGRAKRATINPTKARNPPKAPMANSQGGVSWCGQTAEMGQPGDRFDRSEFCQARRARRGRRGRGTATGPRSGQRVPSQ